MMSPCTDHCAIVGAAQLNSTGNEPAFSLLRRQHHERDVSHPAATNSTYIIQPNKYNLPGPRYLHPIDEVVQYRK
jgi:hypothetical protein